MGAEGLLRGGGGAEGAQQPEQLIRVLKMEDGVRQPVGGKGSVCAACATRPSPPLAPRAPRTQTHCPHALIRPPPANASLAAPPGPDRPPECPLQLACIRYLRCLQLAALPPPP